MLTYRFIGDTGRVWPHLSLELEPDALVRAEHNPDERYFEEAQPPVDVAEDDIPIFDVSPPAVLYASGDVTEEEAARLKEQWLASTDFPTPDADAIAAIGADSEFVAGRKFQRSDVTDAFTAGPDVTGGTAGPDDHTEA